MENKKQKENESNLKNLKEDYEILKEKYGLPEFRDFNEDFQIERISEIETDFLLREIRKFISDRISNYMRFLESLLNPTNAPLFIFSLCKALTANEKKEIENLYKDLMKIELELLEIDIRYSEEKEAEFIKSTFEFWKDFKRKWLGIIKTAKDNWDNKLESTNKGYFG
jgi:hypothetical protein